jgi:hypothetical protein
MTNQVFILNKLLFVIPNERLPLKLEEKAAEKLILV